MAEMMHRLQAAMNAHDLDAFVACFAADYDSEQPAHPGRAFRVADQVRRNWEGVVAGVPRSSWARRYVEPVEEGGADIGETVEETYRPPR